MANKQSVRAIIINGDKLLAMKRNKFGAQYYMLIGGGMKIGESPEQALQREIDEEIGVQVSGARLVFVEDDGGFYGAQYVYLCEYASGEPTLRADSDEAQITTMGQNTYAPVWLPLQQLGSVPFRSASVAEAILDGAQHGFPETPRQLAWKPENVSK